MPILSDELRLALIAEEFARVGASAESWEQNFGAVPSSTTALEIQEEFGLPLVTNVAPGGASGVQIMPTGEIAAIVRADAPAVGGNVGGTEIVSAGGQQFYIFPSGNPTVGVSPISSGPVDPEGFGIGFKRISGAPRASAPGAVVIPFRGSARVLPWAGLRGGVRNLGLVGRGAIV